MCVSCLTSPYFAPWKTLDLSAVESVRSNVFHGAVCRKGLTFYYAAWTPSPCWLILHVLQLLQNDALQGMTLSEVVQATGTIYIPDSNSRLRSAAELCYNEPECAGWVPAGEGDNFSHELIPYSISKQLGVNTSRAEVLSRHSRGIGFGQRERLTARIKRILSGYPCDKVSKTFTSQRITNFCLICVQLFKCVQF
jgi:hypothetical protein